MVKKIKKLLISQEEFDKKFCYGNKEFIAAYLRDSIKEFNKTHDKRFFFISLFDVIKWEGITKFAKKIGMSRVGIYDALVREKANPSFETLQKIFKGLNLKLKFDIEEIEERKGKKQNYSQYQSASVY